MNPYDDDNMFLRHIRQQIQDAQKGNLLNEQLMQSMNRPSNIQNPFYTQVTQGDPGRFASSRPLQFPGTTVPKNMPPNVVPPPVPPMNMPNIQPKSYNMPYANPKMYLPDSPDAIGGPMPPNQQNSPLDFILKSLMGR